MRIKNKALEIYNKFYSKKRGKKKSKEYSLNYCHFKKHVAITNNENDYWDKIIKRIREI